MITDRDIRFSTATAAEVSEGLAALLLAVVVYLRRYVVVTDHQATAIALWAAHTHAIDAAECTPYLHIGSATKRAGKTRLLETLEPVVARPWFTGRTSAAALVRKVDADCPTLLLDESDAAFAGEKEYAEALRGILNTGYRRSGKCTVCVGQGANIQARDFSTFGPKAIAGIGRLPDTVADRSITIRLRRRTTDEPCERWRERDGHAEARPLWEALAKWAADGADEILREKRPSLPASLGDRQADVWEPLLAIADLAGGDWPQHARAAAEALAGSAEDSDITVELLRDIAGILAELPGHLDIVSSTTLIEMLTELDDRPWATWRKGDKPITPRGLARLLEPLDIHAGRWKVHGEKVRGYRREAFNDVIARYLGSHVAMWDQPNKDGQKAGPHVVSEPPVENSMWPPKKPVNIGSVPHGHIDPGDGGNPGLTPRQRERLSLWHQSAQKSQ